MLPRIVAAVVIAVSLSAFASTPVMAQELLASAALGAHTGLLPNALSRSALFPLAPITPAETVVRSAAPDFSRVRRPALLPALYAANVALQAMDAHSTLKALDDGAREANPLMKGVAGHRGALLAVKAGAAAGTIYFAEKLWRRNRVAAIALMAAVNGVSAAVVAHNYRVASRLR